MFSGSGCTYQSTPIRTNKGPFCKSDCISSEIPSSYATDHGDNWDDDNLYSNSNESQNENIANDSHQQSVQARALARASSSSTSSTTTTIDKPPKKLCYYPVTKNAPMFLRNPLLVLAVANKK